MNVYWMRFRRVSFAFDSSSFTGTILRTFFIRASIFEVYSLIIKLAQLKLIHENEIVSQIAERDNASINGEGSLALLKLSMSFIRIASLSCTNLLS